MTNVVTLVGNPRVGSRTLGVAEHVTNALVEGLDVTADRVTIDLATVAGDLFDWDAANVAALSEQVAAADLLVVASPTFKATYTGLLKAFLDRYGNRALAGVVAVPVLVGAGSAHALAVEVHLRPLLVELGASVPTGGLYVTEAEMTDLATALTPWLAAALPPLGRALDAPRV